MADYVILDCDGVLVDSEPISNATLAAVLSDDYGIPYTAEESVRDFMGRPFTHVEELLGPLPGLHETYHERLYAAFDRSLEAIPGVEAALAALDPMPMCVASSGEPERMRRVLGRTGLLGRFEGRLFSTVDVVHGKPAPDLFLHAAAEMGWEPSRCAVVEDSPAGVAAGRAAGMRVLGFARATPADALREAGAHAVFADMAELPALLRG